ncbi:hypothetical protein MKX08_010321 [Trichoderma sp. CBMAI-0020]|nr:hypothetical protein MKX08_010321 [Trichoderma sp. CBMAI-0020]
MELVRQYPWVATAVDWLEETTPSASVWSSVQLFSSSSRRAHGRKRQPQAPIGANTVDSSTAASGVTLFSYRPVLWNMRAAPCLCSGADYRVVVPGSNVQSYARFRPQGLNGRSLKCDLRPLS